MKQSHSWKVNCLSAYYEVTRAVWSSRDHCHVDKNWPVGLVLSHSVLKIYFNIILPVSSSCAKKLRPFGDFSLKCVHYKFHPIPSVPLFLWLEHPKIMWRRIQIITFRNYVVVAVAILFLFVYCSTYLVCVRPVRYETEFLTQTKRTRKIPGTTGEERKMPYNRYFSDLFLL
jgi:hypothetical protein